MEKSGMLEKRLSLIEKRTDELEKQFSELYKSPHEQVQQTIKTARKMKWN
jgi:hypothetical protein